MSVPVQNPKAMTIAGYILSGLVILFLLFDSVIKLFPLPVVIETLTGLGYPPSENLARGLGIVTLICLALYAVPRTALLGAVLLTGYLGGAMATHLRAGSPLFSHLLFGFYVGLLLWAGLWLRDPKVRAVMPFLRQAP
ncbi:DoxX family protein [Pararhizobium sp.]|uniref:DoxX family protein n=1 Tax=Pararhizobium sp. TaxID=1977563 RepID=UPI002726F3A4|nr:DoxX family protein [Pararhizobium sp.]MDO9414668.1 DoxX family protein [Pararhizobium sp.]